MFIKSGKVGSYVYMITGTNNKVIVEISQNSKVLDCQDNMSLNEAFKYIEYFVSKGKK